MLHLLQYIEWNCKKLVRIICFYVVRTNSNALQQSSVFDVVIPYWLTIPFKMNTFPICLGFHPFSQSWIKVVFFLRRHFTAQLLCLIQSLKSPSFKIYDVISAESPHFRYKRRHQFRVINSIPMLPDIFPLPPDRPNCFLLSTFALRCSYVGGKATKEKCTIIFWTFYKKEIAIFQPWNISK